MRVTASATIDDIMSALNLPVTPEGFERYDTIDIHVDLDEDEARDALPAIDPDPLSVQLDQSNVMDLAAAIHRGDRAEAELLLDLILADDETVMEWVQRGRFSKKGRPAERALAKAA